MRWISIRSKKLHLYRLFSLCLCLSVQFSALTTPQGCLACLFQRLRLSKKKKKRKKKSNTQTKLGQIRMRYSRFTSHSHNSFSSLEKKHSLVVFHFNLIIKWECRCQGRWHCVRCVLTNIHLCALWWAHMGADFSSVLNPARLKQKLQMERTSTFTPNTITHTNTHTYIHRWQNILLGEMVPFASKVSLYPHNTSIGSINTTYQFDRR